MSAPLGISLLAYAGAYGLLARRVRRRGRPVPVLRAVAFGLGLAAVGLALARPLDDAAAGGSLLAHMAQHELLLNVAPVLLWLGLDARLAAPVTRAVGGTLARRPGALRALRVAASPALAVGLYVCVVAAWHVPGLYAAAAASPVLHPLEHLTFLWTGLLFWFHLLRPLPSVRPLRTAGAVAYLAAGTAGAALLAAVLVGAPEAVYPASVSSGLADQRLAGALMMGVEMPLALAVGLAVLVRSAQRRPRRGPLWLGT